MSFLDTLVSHGPDNSLLKTVYRKPTHKDQYPHWESQHSLSSKFSVFNTLMHSTRNVCVNPQLLHKKEEHIKRALQGANVPPGHLIDTKSKGTTNTTPLSPTVPSGTTTTQLTTTATTTSSASLWWYPTKGHLW